MSIYINFILQNRNWKLMINVSIPLVALFKDNVAMDNKLHFACREHAHAF